MKLYVDSDCVRTETVIENGVPVVRPWKGAYMVPIAIMHLGSGQVTEMSLASVMHVCTRCEIVRGKTDCQHRGETSRDLVLDMIRTGVWPRAKPVVHGPEGDEALLLRDMIDAYWRTRTDLERAPRFVVWDAAGGEDASEIMGWHTGQEAVAAFARGRWRLVGCPASMAITALEGREERRLTVLCSGGAFVVSEVQA